MNEQISERGCTLETDVAVIQSNYVRRDEFSALREEMGVGFAKVNAKIDLVQAELVGKMDVGFAQLNSKIDVGYAELNTKIDVGYARLDARINSATTTLLKWMFASQISVAAMFIAAIKYL
jgi:hypothetical protein